MLSIAFRSAWPVPITEEQLLPVAGAQLIVEDARPANVAGVDLLEKKFSRIER
jgi:hypothetical protein